MRPDGPCVHLFGPPRLQIGERALAFRPDLRFRLLAYLAHGASREQGGVDASPAVGGWVDRTRIAFLFWPDSDEPTARKRLSQLLKRLGRLDGPDRLERDPHRLRWAVASDVAAFRAATRRGDAVGALELYRGPFLEGLEADAPIEFARWLEHERAALRGDWRRMVLGEAERQLRRGVPASAASALEGLVTDDPLDEEALQRYLQALASDDRRIEALQRYRRFARTLRDELSLEPSATSRALIARIEAGQDAAGAERPAQGGAGLPAPATPFVGRRRELAALADWLAVRDGYRLVTLVGPGGVGKSRLALQAMHDRPAAAARRAAYVALDAVFDRDAMLREVARALELEPSLDPDELLERIVATLAGERRLLVLDNAEQVEGAGAALADLVRRCPGLVCLVTSRERLGVRAERLLPLDGLSYPTEPVPLAEAMRHDAVAMFVQRVRRLWPSYEPTEADAPGLVALCRVTQGLPLALELAAAWIRPVGLAHLAARVAEDVDLLASDDADVPARHRSMRAAFEHAWRRLADGERAVLRRTAVFRGGFRGEAAEAVAGASAPVLASLVDKSLLRASPGGRYDRHPLLDRFVLEKLRHDPSERRELEERHARYYLDAVRHHASALYAPPSEQRDALDAVVAERENLRQAWNLAVRRGWSRVVVGVLEPLERFFQRSGRTELLLDLFRTGVAAFEGRDDARDALGALLAKQGWYAQRVGRLDDAVALSERGLELLRPGGPSRGLGQALNTLGFVAQQRERHREGARFMREALEVARRVGDPWYLAGFGNNLAIIETRLGRYEAAARHYEETLRLNRDRGDLAEVAINLLNYAELEVRRGALDRAAERIAEGAALAHELGFVDIEPHYLALEGDLALARGDVERARRLCLEAIDDFGLPAERPDVVDRYLELGRIELRRGEPDAAEAAFVQGLALARRAGYAPGFPRALMGVADARAARGRTHEAASLLTALGRSDELPGDLRRRVAAALERIGVEPQETPDRGTGPTVEAIAVELLRTRPDEGGSAFTDAPSEQR